MKKIWARRTITVALVALALFAGNFGVRAQKQKQIDVSFEEKLLATIPEEFDFVGDPIFSPDGKKVAFGAKKGRELWWKVVDVESYLLCLGSMWHGKILAQMGEFRTHLPST